MGKMEFKQYLLEEQEKHAVFAFGRMNPPTTGHEKLINKVHEVAKANKASHVVILSHSQDPKKNPLSGESKLKHAKRFFPKTNLKLSSKEAPNFLHHAAELHKQGVTHLHMVAGSDRAADFNERLHKYNGTGEGKLYNFKKITVHSSGERDPDSEGTEGMSASKMREHAKSGNFKEFKKGIPSHVTHEHARELFSDVRHSMNLKEEKDTRQRYVDGEIFALGETVFVEEGKGEVVYCGPNYVTVRLDEMTSLKKWLADVSETQWVEPKIEPFRSAKIKESKIPVILMTKQQKQRLHEESSQISYMNYTTKNLDMCPAAKAQLEDLIGRKEVTNYKFVLQAIQATDNYLGIEKKAQKEGFADHEDIHEFLKQLSIAHDTLNILGYPDKDLEYMKGHLKSMSELSMHRDTSFANEYGTHETVIGAGTVEEDTKIEITDADGKKTTKKIPSKDIIKDKEMKEAKTFKEMRKPVCEEDQTQQDTQRRDVNRTPDKEVFMGIDKPEAGMFSFKHYLTTQDEKVLSAAHKKDEEDVESAVTQHGEHSIAYHQMRKAHAQE